MASEGVDDLETVDVSCVLDLSVADEAAVLSHPPDVDTVVRVHVAANPTENSTIAFVEFWSGVRA